MQIVIDVMEDGMVSVSADGGEPMGPMPLEDALAEISAMVAPAPDESAMWDEEAAAMEPEMGMPEDEMMGDM